MLANEMEEQPEAVEQKIAAPTTDAPLQKRRFESIPSETAIIFDWDDTLLASSFLSSKGFRLDVPLQPTGEIEADLRKLESCVISLLNLAMTHGRTFIITNAETGWVQLSAQVCLRVC
eukprot:TRINITY_DN2162_c0_g2_i1.p5 TRINITY_DN2162_c0_g2~~TRINITY_DN2162_c0_g2_i1.p5  ORF type:complete len:118 (+),score=37.77 TRINITY_DN2162_c0_g2_i1:265-618(+)